MTADSRAWSRWLPGAALAAALPVDACDTCLRDWSLRWFAGGMVHGGSGWQPRGGEAASGAATGWAIDRQVRLTLQPGGAARLGELMFGSSAVADELTDADRDRLDGAINACLADLRRMVADAIGSANGWAGGEGGQSGWAYALSLTTGTGGALASLALHRDLLVQRRTGGIAAPAGRPLVSRNAALAAQRVRLGVRVGTARLSLRQLASLTRGDVVLLDRRVDALLDLTVSDVPTTVPCRLAEADDRLVLQL